MKKGLYVLVCVILLFSVMGCGKTAELKSVLSAQTPENQFPDIPEKSFATMEDAGYSLYEQQLGACRMYYDAYSMCDSAQYKDDFGSSPKIMAVCNETRLRLYDDIDYLFEANIMKILADVSDCRDKATYFSEIRDDCVDFSNDLHSLETAEDVDSEYARILVNYSESNNIVARNMLSYCRESVIDSVTAVISRSVQCQDDDIRMNISDNNDMIRSLNETYGSLPDDNAQIISSANHELYKRLSSLMKLSPEEEKNLLKEIVEPSGL